MYYLDIYPYMHMYEYESQYAYTYAYMYSSGPRVSIIHRLGVLGIVSVLAGTWIATIMPIYPLFRDKGRCLGYILCPGTLLSRFDSFWGILRDSPGAADWHPSFSLRAK